MAAEDLVGAHYERPFDCCSPSRATPGGVVAADYVTTDDGIGHRPPGPRLRRGRREVAERGGPADPQPGRPTAPSTRSSVPRVRGPVRQGRRPRHHRRPRRRAACSCAIGRLHHCYPHCWRCGTPLIYWAKPDVVRAHLGARPTLLARERDHQLAPRPHQARPVRQVARGQRRLGAVPRPLLGHARADLALPRLRPRHVRRIGRRAVRAGRAAISDRSRPAPALRRRRHARLRRVRTAARAYRVEPVLDAWFDSGSMPSAQFHYPFENDDVFHRRFPADFICEAIDQTRGWFYSLLAVNTLVFDRTPYRNVVCLALHRRRGRPEDVQVAGATSSPRGPSRTNGRRRAALVLLLVGLAVDAEAGVPRGHRRVHPPACSRCGTPSRSSSPTPTSTAGRPGSGPVRRARPRARPLDPRGSTRPSRTVDRRARSFDALRGDPGAGRALHRRPVQLVRAPLPPRFWKTQRSRRARHAPRVPAAHDAAARAVLPVPGRRHLPATRPDRASRCT